MKKIKNIKTVKHSLKKTLTNLALHSIDDFNEANNTKIQTTVESR